LHTLKRGKKSIRGWFPDADRFTVYQAVDYKKWHKQRIGGLLLLSLGISLFIASFFFAAKTDYVVNSSFILEPNEKLDPYENGTFYHTHVIGSLYLVGEVTVESGAVGFTADGYSTQSLKNVFINENYTLAIDSAQDQYTFTFENLSSDQSKIRFTLKESWLDVVFLVPASIVLIVAVSTGLLIIKRSSKKEKVFGL
jgi:hypothetical protein